MGRWRAMGIPFMAEIKKGHPGRSPPPLFSFREPSATSGPLARFCTRGHVKICADENPSADLPATAWLPAGPILARAPSADLPRSFRGIGMDNVGMAGDWGCKLANGVRGAAKTQILPQPFRGLVRRNPSAELSASFRDTR